MAIEVRIMKESPSAYSSEPFTLQDSQANLLPEVGDYIDQNGQLEVKGRVFAYRKDLVIVTLLCDV